MSKKRRSRSNRGPSWASRAWSRAGAVSWRRVLRGVFNLAMVGGVVFGSRYGLPLVEEYVTARSEYQRPLRVELADMPAWLESNEHVVRGIISHCGITSRDRRLDSGLAARVGRAVSRVGWVKEVKQVNVGADDIIRVRCVYREPIAWVGYGSSYYLVDTECVRLPGRYAPDEVSREGGLLAVTGVAKPPPAEGETWEGADVKAGVQLVVMLRDRSYVDQIAAVMVGNYGGRQDRRRAHIELATDKGTRIRWGRAPGEEVDEPTAEQKLAQLQGLWRQYRRVDMGRPWVDIQGWPDRVSVPLCSWQESVRRRS